MPMFTFYTDPGHGWLQVSTDDLDDVGLKPTDFSRYSYRDGTSIFYLEEDCDAPKFAAAYRAKHGHDPAYRERHHNSNTPIRRMQRIH